MSQIRSRAHCLMLRYVLLRHNCIYVRTELFCFTRISSYLLCFYWKSSLASPCIVHLERWTTDHLASPRITHYLMCFYWEKCGVLPASPRITAHHLASPRITSHHLKFLPSSRNTIIVVGEKYSTHVSVAVTFFPAKYVFNNIVRFFFFFFFF